MTDFLIHSLPVLKDNYIHILSYDKFAAVIDPAEAIPVQTFLKQKNLQLTHILLTHHHADHTGGVKELKESYADCEVIGFMDDEHRLPPLNKKVKEGDQLIIHGGLFEVWHLPGHTTGHIGFISKTLKVAFTGDVLFGMGCGRVFEGTYTEMFQSLQRFKSLDATTRIYCTHEYTVNNGKFSITALPDNSEIRERLEKSLKIRANGNFTVPLLLSEELKTNPFLMAQNLSEFSGYRDARNQF